MGETRQRQLGENCASKESWRSHRSYTPVGKRTDNSVLYLNSILTRYSFEPLSIHQPASQITLGKYNELYRIIDSSTPTMKPFVELSSKFENSSPKYDPEVILTNNKKRYINYTNDSAKRLKTRIILKKNYEIKNNSKIKDDELVSIYERSYKKLGQKWPNGEESIEKSKNAESEVKSCRDLVISDIKISPKNALRATQLDKISENKYQETACDVRKSIKQALMENLQRKRNESKPKLRKVTKKICEPKFETQGKKRSYTVSVERVKSPTDSYSPVRRFTYETKKKPSDLSGWDQGSSIDVHDINEFTDNLISSDTGADQD